MNSKLRTAINKHVKEARVGIDVVVPFFIDSGNYALNYILSGSLLNGWPAGRIIELFGDPATGKSLLLAHAIADTQRKDGVAILDDVENAFSADFGRKLGMDIDELILLNSMMLEDHVTKVEVTDDDGRKKEKKEKIRGHLNTVSELVTLVRKEDTNCPIFVGLDSLAQLTTKHEQEVGLDAVDMSKAKVVRAFMRLVGGVVAKQQVCYVATNHSTSTVSLYGPATTTPGGTGVKYSATLRVELKLRDKIKTAKGKVIGVITRARCVKNRVTAPFKECEIEIYFDSGADRYSGLFDLLQLEEVVQQPSPGWYCIPELDPDFGKKDLKELVKYRKADFIEQLLKTEEGIKRIDEVLRTKVVVLGKSPIDSSDDVGMDD